MTARIRSKVSTADALRRIEGTDPSWYPRVLRAVAEIAPNTLALALDKAITENAIEQVAKGGAR